MNDDRTPKNLNQTVQYANTNTGAFQETQQSWEPLDMNNIVDFDHQLQLPELDSSYHSIDEDKEGSQNTKLRRRAQNRASQRAFRERKDRHLKGLEYQLEHLNEKHQDLMQSYMKQSENVMKLNSRLAELRGQVKALKARPAHSSSSERQSTTDGSRNSQSLGSFDAFSFSSPQDFASLDEREISLWSDLTTASKPGEILDENGLPAFEDLLNLK
ncbi:hypothetical protein LTR84_000577 [Exophiala bonariae]|uniref:BZIP domain-containing protein n=1 Tax=Exophiala bonariae TaxID=1690606 RepID=A0AAV9NUZ6_9EURO|nr:hypothetical protein LTR84_000577 [Exophiala bonariae]